MNRIFSPFASLKQSARTVFAIALVLALPITLFLTQSPKDTRQFAQETTTTPTPAPSYSIQTESDMASYTFTLPNQADLVNKMKEIGIFGANIISLKGLTNGVPLSNIVIHLTDQPQEQPVILDSNTHKPLVTADVKIAPGKADVYISFISSELNTPSIDNKKADYAVFISLYTITHPVKSVKEINDRNQSLTILLQGLPSDGYLKLIKL